MDDALIAVDQNRITVQRLGGNVAGVDHHRNGQGPRDNSGMRTDAAFFQNDAFQLAAIIQQLRRTNVARHQHRVVGHRRPGILALPGQDSQQTVRQIVQIVQPFAQVSVLNLLQPVARGGLFLFHGSLGR